MQKKLGLILLIFMILEILAWLAIGFKAPWTEAEKMRAHFASAISKRCSIMASLHPHPYTGFAPIQAGPCRYTSEVPIERDNSFYTILFTGGSVAAQLAGLKGLNSSYLEEELNKTWKHPMGKKFRVINLAVPGGAWPQSKIFTMLHGSAVDAVVELAGYNETSGLMGSSLPGVPHAIFYATRSSHPLDTPRSWSLRLLDLIVHTPLFSILPSQVLISQLILRNALQTQSLRDPWFEVIEKNFRVPEDWSMEKKQQIQLSRAVDFARDGSMICQHRKLLCLTFLQPIAMKDKLLTEKELLRINTTHETKRAKRYFELIQALKGERDIIDASNVFKNVADTIYADPVHFKRDQIASPSKGEVILIDFMLQALGEKGKWQKNSNHTSR